MADHPAPFFERGALNMVIDLTERAIREVRKILLEQTGSKARCLRLGVRGGGCAGFTYIVDLCSRPTAEDRTVETHGVKIVCDPVSALYLDGTVVDFIDEPTRRGFVFQNPNARETCPCGTSFGI